MSKPTMPVLHAARSLVALALLLCITGHSLAQSLPPSPAPEGASATILSPVDGAVLQSPVTVRFGLSGMGVAPAGVQHDNTGHHHLLIDLETLPPMDQPLPASEQLRHFGGGQTEVTIELAPGVHTLQLLLGDYKHQPHQPPVLSEKITITVE